jgi:FO synthase
MSDKTRAIVPVRQLAQGKSRLLGVLTPQARVALVESLLANVLRALSEAEHIGRIIVVTPDEALSVPPGVERWQDLGIGLDAAVSFALRTLCAEKSGAGGVLVIAADTPGISASAVDQLLERVVSADVAVVPDRKGEGTNALWLARAMNFPTRYGPHSARRHLDNARALGLHGICVEMPALAMDVDVAEDLCFAPLSRSAAYDLLDRDLPSLLRAAEQRTREGFGLRVGYSRKVFIPLTHWCRDVCHYCTFAAPPRKGAKPFLDIEEILKIATEGVRAGCDEALFTLGDQPEDRYPAARAALDALGFSSTLDYLEYCARRVFEETGLLPHLNPGVMDTAMMQRLRRVSASMGIMLESSALRLTQKGGPHHRSPDKLPAVRLATLERAGQLSIPFTTGLLIGIGETRAERLDTLLDIRDLHERYGHIQEIIIQNFRAKPGTRMAGFPDAPLIELQWTIAVTRLLFGAGMSIQAPPNLSAGHLEQLIAAGVNDWGGVSPVTPDHVNPEAPWPQLTALEKQTRAAGRWLVQRLPVVPRYAQSLERWLDPGLHAAVRRRLDSEGYARERHWYAGAGMAPEPRYAALMSEAQGPSIPRIWQRAITGSIERSLRAARRGQPLASDDLLRLFAADGADFSAVIAAADELREHSVGDAVTYVINRNINYTNICSHSCGFCAFAKGRSARSLRGPGYRLDLEEIGRRVTEAWQRGATEVCLQGGIHPAYTGETYLQIVETARRAAPGIHIHAFSPLEVTHGAATLGLSLDAYLERLAHAGLRSLPGTAAEILVDEVRATLCADKLSSADWLGVMRAAHRQGLRSTATIMFGHIDTAAHWAQHLLSIRHLQRQTGGFTEFVPLPFVHMEAPLWRRGVARSGPSYREAMLMHAVARLALAPVIQNIQASWVKLGPDGAAQALLAGANDLGGVLMDESITRAAGGVNGQQMDAPRMRAAIASIGRRARERSTLYAEPPPRHGRMEWESEEFAALECLGAAPAPAARCA